MEEKVYKSNKISLEFLKQLKDSEVEIDCLKSYIVDLKQRMTVYLPVKDDPVDRKLADFINNFQDRNKLKIMFLREKPDLYQFGSKKVSIKIDAQGNLKVKVGGGFLTITEFVDQYTPIEVEKLEKLGGHG
mmetsp:Transcript_15162/g.25689  ORF Transcript_15162/g.25689 Transcript_15162/m.25689 type:complete len:131 (+) Transcript_15162:92-484(+)